MSFNLEPIGYIQSCFTEKFGIPRQSGLAPAARAILQLNSEYCLPGMLDGLQEFSHLWLIFVFHACLEQGWKAKVRPPRLGGNHKLGVYATRSNFRPNPLGLSAVQLLNVDCERQQLLLAGADLLDGTPILDIKPYLPYADSHPQAQASFAQQPPSSCRELVWSAEALTDCLAYQQRYPELQQLIEQVLIQDPRPAYQQDVERIYGLKLWQFNLRWQIKHEQIHILSVQPASS